MNTAKDMCWAMVFLFACESNKGADAGTDASIQRDSGTAEAMDTPRDTTASTVIRDYYAELTKVYRQDCECNLRGQPDVDACTGARLADARVRTCDINAFESGTYPELGNYYRCYAQALQTQALCLDGAECNMTTAGMCTTTFRTAISNCPVVSMDESDRNTASIVTCVAGGAGVCPGTEPPSLRTGMNVFSGTTFQRGADMVLSCARATEFAPESVHRWTAPFSGVAVFSVRANFDSVIAVKTACETPSDLGCNDDTDGTASSEVEVFVDQGTTYVVIVDGSGPLAAGDYSVDIVQQNL